MALESQGERTSRSRGIETQRVTRLAPSPTGALHLGNARTFLVTWALARREGMRIVLRLEDLDGPRVKPQAAQQCINTLRWLGMDWDEGPLVQSDDLSPYENAVRTLAEARLAYPSDLSRKDIEEALSAPHARDSSIDANGSESRFPPELRPHLRPRAFDDRETNWRFVVPDEDISFTDRFAGAQTHHPAATVGDFPIWTKRGAAAYQLAVVVDDHRQGVTDVIRGDDLLDSAARQILLQRALGLPQPRYTHLPLVLGEDGRRLAKRHGDTRVDHYREQGTPPERIIGLLASWSGALRKPTPMSAPEFAQGFDLTTMPRTAVVFKPEDDAWLLQR